jgi:hypothetical protein
VNAYEYILSKQIQWALNNKISLVGSKGNRGRLAYTENLEDNLFQPLKSEVREYFEGGDGGELTAKPGNAPKMHAVHSSSALTVNIFQYWLKINQIPPIAAACGFCDRRNKNPIKIKFETKFPIDENFPRSPNLDVIIENSAKSRFKVFAVECKFSEAYSSRGHSGIDPKYFTSADFWTDLPNLKSFSKTISPGDNSFQYLHSAQLVKHILGLRKRYGKNRFRLLYLWYDCLGPAGSKHREEIEEFTRIAKEDNIFFHALSYQELIIKLSNEYRNNHYDYINYISNRYL